MVLLFLCSCSAGMFEYNSASKNLYLAFPNSVMYFDPDEPQYIYIYDTIAHVSFKAARITRNMGVGRIQLLQYLPHENE